MKLSAKERLSLRAMAEFARRYGDGPIALGEVARVEGLPLPYLEQVVPALKHCGLLASVRGMRGGYMLAREPAAISLGDILRAVEGSLMTLDCMGRDGSPCAREPRCATRNVWHRVTELLGQALDGTSLADILR
jgi:Rrf2 family cysteine metabolism transcriptional repressor